MIFGMQHCFNLTRRNMEDYLILFENGWQPNFLKMEDDHIFLKMEDYLNCLKMESDLNFF
jgi:hypothetical protein